MMPSRRGSTMRLSIRLLAAIWIPVMVVVGDRDQEAGAVSPRLRTGDSSQGVPLNEFVAELRTLAESRELWPVPSPSEA